jgi:hypothetical protein
MSVTFTTGQFETHPEFGVILAHGARCNHSRPASCCEDAAIYHGQCEHAEADETAHGCRAHEVNVSNANAAALLEILGLRTDAEPEGEILGGLPVFGEMVGDCEGEKFLGRVLTARALLDARGDGGTPATVKGGTTSALIVDCGRAPGYLAERLGQLEDLATTAVAREQLVVWA